MRMWSWLVFFIGKGRGIGPAHLPDRIMMSSYMFSLVSDPEKKYTRVIKSGLALYQYLYFII